jgi:hypothetical protein
LDQWSSLETNIGSEKGWSMETLFVEYLWTTDTSRIRRVCVRHVSVSVSDTDTTRHLWLQWIMTFFQIIIGVAVSMSVSCPVSMSVSVLHSSILPHLNTQKRIVRILVDLAVLMIHYKENIFFLS